MYITMTYKEFLKNKDEIAYMVVPYRRLSKASEAVEDIRSEITSLKNRIVNIEKVTEDIADEILQISEDQQYMPAKIEEIDEVKMKLEDLRASLEDVDNEITQLVSFRMKLLPLIDKYRQLIKDKLHEYYDYE